MKKYVKPELIFESFELSQQIAVCDFDSKGTHSDVYSCTFEGANEDFPEPATYFASSNGACKNTSDSYCYHGSTDGFFNLFNS